MKDSPTRKHDKKWVVRMVAHISGTGQRVRYEVRKQPHQRTREVCFVLRSGGGGVMRDEPGKPGTMGPISADPSGVSDKVLAEWQDKWTQVQQRTDALEDKVLMLQSKVSGQVASISLLLTQVKACDGCQQKLAQLQKSIEKLEERLAKAETKPEARPEAKPSQRDPLPSPPEKPAATGLPPVWPLPSTPAKIGISYVHFIGSVKGTQADEYVEIKNTGGTAQDISGWRVHTGSLGQDFRFPAGAVLSPGGTFRIYTDLDGTQASAYSLGSKRALWNDLGGLGRLYDADNKLVSEYGYLSKETRSIDSIKGAYGVEKLQVSCDKAQLDAQSRPRDKVDFLTALERAIRSLFDDSAEGAGRNAANQVRDHYDGVPRGAGADLIQRFIRMHLNQNKLVLLSEDSPERANLAVSTKEHWIFRLDRGMGSCHFIIVERSGAQDAYQQIS